MNISDQDEDTQPTGRSTRQNSKRKINSNKDTKNFECGCGKSYKSESTLKTHIKTAHKGKAPANTSQPQANGKTEKKISKKESKASKKKDEEMEEEKEEIETSNEFDNLIKFLNELSGKIAYDGQKIEENQNSLITKAVEVDPIKEFPVDLFKGREDEYQVVLEDLNALISGKAMLDESVDPETDLKQTPINKIFAIFLSKVSRHLRRALNQIGYQIKNKQSGKKDETDQKKEFCENNNGEYVPEISNDFLAKYLPAYLKEYNLKGFKVIGSEDSQIKNAVHLTKHFCNWMNIQNYTCSHLIMNDVGN